MLPADPNDPALINQELARADQVEKDAPVPGQQQNWAGSPSNKTPPIIALGQTIDQVTGSLGAPVTVVPISAPRSYTSTRT